MRPQFVVQVPFVVQLFHCGIFLMVQENLCVVADAHLVLWRGPCSMQRQAWELISGSDLATGALLLSFNLLAPEFYI